MDLRNAQRQYDNQEPESADVDKLIKERIEEIKFAVTNKKNIYYKDKPYRAAQHVYDWMDFSVIYSIIQNAQTMDEMQLGEFVKTVVTKAIETAAENDIETDGV